MHVKLILPWLVWLCVVHGMAWCADDDANAARAQRLRAALRAPTTLKVRAMPLKKVLGELSRQHHVEIKINAEALAKAEIAVDAPVTITSTELSLERVLDWIEEDLGVRYMLEEGAIVITAAPRLKNEPAVAPNRAPVPADAPAAAPDGFIRQNAFARGKPVVPLPAPANVAAVPHPAVVAVEERCESELRPILRMQLRFIEQVCQPTPAEMQAIRADAEEVLRDTVRIYVNSLARINTPWDRIVRKTGANDPRWDLREGIADIVIDRLSNKQIRRFLEESNVRDDNEARIIRVNVVSSIDEKIHLSEPQRQRLLTLLEAEWKQGWCPSVEASLEFDDFLPPIPDDLISPVLSPGQLTNWKRIPKGGGVATHHGFGVLGLKLVDPGDDRQGDDAKSDDADAETIRESPP